MPPRANRQPKTADDTAKKAKSRQLGFVDRVHLPALQDTPSSRRQYSYGAPAEPIAPRRFTGDYADKPYDLDNAIKHALERQARELEQERIAFPQPDKAQPAASPARQTKPRVRETTREPDMDDELAAAAFPPPRKGDPVAPSEGDDVRSFAIESDVYGDATIQSTPDITNDAALNFAQRSVNRRDARRRSQKGSADPAFRDTGSDESSGDELGLRRSRRRRTQLAKADAQVQDGQPVSSKAATNPPTETVEEVTQPIQSRLSKDKSANAHARPAAAPAPAKIAPSQRESPRSLARQLQAKQLEAEQRRRAAAQQEEAEQRQAAARQDAAAKASRAQVAPSSSEESASDRSELDAALQDDIQAREDALESARRGELNRQTWQQRWDYMQSLSPTKYLRRHDRQVPITHEDDDDETGNDSAHGWRKLVDPSEYFDAINRFFLWISRTLSTFWGHVLRFSPSGYNMAAFVVALCFLTAALSTSQTLRQTDGYFESPESSRFSALEPLRYLSNGMHSIIPVIARPFQSSIDRLIDISDIDENGKVDLAKFLKKYGEELKQIPYLKTGGIEHSRAIKRLEKVVPKVVHMELEDGKPVIAEDFWLALRDRIHGDEDILTVQENGDLTKKPWKLVSSKILEDHGLESKLSKSVSDAETRMDAKIGTAWDTWIQNNNDKLRKMMGEPVENIQSMGTDEQLKAQLARLVREQDRSTEPQDGTFVTRSQFLTHVQNEFVEHRSKIKVEIQDLRQKVEKLAEDTTTRYNHKHGQGEKLSNEARMEVTTLVNHAISDALANANLGALAKGKIQHHWDTVLKNQINYFSQGSGATVNAADSSSTYDPYRKGVINRNDLDSGVPGARRWDRYEALTDWSDDGDKWCAARDLNKDGKPYGYMLGVHLGRPVIPQHIVVEHILPGATIDPDARPRDIEVYARIEDAELRERLQDFASANIGHFAGDDAIAPLKDGMVLIGRFTYAGAELHEGVFVHKLSGELTALGAETSEMVIRAVNNYGAPDHTCFYRVRMYGTSLRNEVVTEKPAEQKSFWQRMTE
ncbi:hypothetical protein CC79DRAFT_919768 [Sarocladium strictum]